MDSETTTELTIAQKLDACVMESIGESAVLGFEKAFKTSTAIGKLRDLLTEEYMKPIMLLQGTKLGFRTDKDKNKDGTKGPGYPMDIVRDCLINAVLFGLQPTGNQFNIIGGGMYPTKEGLGYRLNNFPGLEYDIKTGLPRINTEKTSCAFNVEITWTLRNENKKAIVEIPIKIDQWTSVDAMVGKATRKGRAWLLSRVSGMEVTDSDLEDQEAKVLSTKTKETKSSDDIKRNRMQTLVNDCKTKEELLELSAANPDFPGITEMIEARKEEIKQK